MNVLGIDVGGSGIKGAVVDVRTGEIISERLRLPTPQPATPEEIAQVVSEMVMHFDWKEAVGCSFPTIIHKGMALTSGNISKEWVGVKVDELLSKYCGGLTFYVANDADLAGVAEMQLGAGKGKNGKVMMVTIGTGLGTGFFYNGQLIPNIEFGRVFYPDGQLIEHFAGAGAKKKEGLKLSEWADRFDFFLNHLDRVFSPDLIIVGGGLSKKFDKFKERLTLNVPVVAARFRNNAGIIGAAMYVHR